MPSSVFLDLNHLLSLVAMNPCAGDVSGCDRALAPAIAVRWPLLSRREQPLSYGS